MSNLNPPSASISVDFGTSHTVASIRRRDGRVHQQLFDGSPQLPSAVFLNDEGGPVVGADAVHSGRRKPERYEPNPKRRIDDGQILLGDLELPVTSVIAAVLKRVARECEQTLGSGALGPVTVTVPAAWGPTRRHVIADAASAAGLGKVALVPEPVAAASYFVESLGNNVPPGSGVVVYDLGGGTFDATVLRSTPSGFEVLAVDGADDLGGLDFDQALAQHVAASVQPDDERWRRLTAPESPADQRHRTAFLEEIRFAKERLSRSASTDLTIPLLDIDAHLTRDELESVTAPLLERTMRITQGVVRESGLAKEQIAGLYLVGAASRMPLVATMLHRELGLAPAAIEQPELAVSEGGLVAASVSSSPPVTPPPSPALPPYTPQASPAPPSPQPSPTMPMQAPGRPTGPIPAPSPVQSPAMTGPMQPQAAASEPWWKSKRGMAIIGSGAAALLLLVAILVAIPLLRDGTGEDGGDDTAQTGSDQTLDEADDQTSEETPDDGGASGAAGETSGVVDLENAEFGDPVSEAVQAHQGPVTQLRIAELDGKDVAVTGGEDGLVRVWDLTTGDELGVYRGHEYEIGTLAVTEYDGSPVVFSSDGETEAVWNLDDPDEPIDDRTAVVWNVVHWVGVLDDGTPAYASSDYVYQLFTGEELGRFESPPGSSWTLMRVDGEFRGVGINENRVVVTDMETGENASGTFDQLPNEVVAVNIGEVGDSALAVTATNTGSIQAWDLATAEPYGAEATDSFQSIKGLEVVTVNDGAAVLVWGSKGVNLFDLETGEQIENTFSPPVGEEGEEGFRAATAEINGHRVAVTASATGELQVWSIDV